MTTHPVPGRPLRASVLATTALLAACQQMPIDLDLRNRGDGFTTATAVANLPQRPAPDARGVISYPTYQVAVAQRGDTVRSLATRLGLDAAEVASYNGVEPDAALRRDEIVALPRRVAEPSAATGAQPQVATAATAPAPSAINVQTLAAAAIDRAGPTQAALPAPGTATPSGTTTPPATVSAAPSAAEPIRHQVVRGESVYILSRRYGIPVAAIAEWNGLGPDLTIRDGQYLLIPTSATAPAPVAVAGPTAPGAGSPTPVPPSAATPLPDETPAPASAPPPAAPPAPELGPATPAPAAREAQFVRPVEGAIIRAYARGRNDGIDISAPAGTAVRAADAGEVRAITTNTEGIRIVVIKHNDNLLTVYTHIENLTVENGSRVTRGQTIGQVRAGDPSFLHFQVRVGTESRDPTSYLP